MAAISLRLLAVAADALPDLHDHLHDLDARGLQQRLSADRRRSRRPHPCTRDPRYSLFTARRGRHGDGVDRLRFAAGAPAGVLHDEAAVKMIVSAFRAATYEAKLLLV